jgi:protein-tyrosine phosphatase
MTALVERAGRSSEIACDSAGTDGYHEGERADRRMREHARRRGVSLESRSRPLESSDFEEFDLILTMDETNYRDVTARAGSSSTRIQRMTDFCRVHTDREVPDPYYGGEPGFERVLDILEDACAGLLEHLDRR